MRLQFEERNNQMLMKQLNQLRSNYLKNQGFKINDPDGLMLIEQQ